MPMPWTYRHASREWRAFLDDVREATGLTSDNMAYTAVDGVLPRVPGAADGGGWAALRQRPAGRPARDLRGGLGARQGAPLPFTSRTEMTREAQALRPHHNLTPDNAIEAVARALWRSVRHAELERVLATLPEGAQAFWHVETDSPEDLAPRIV
jgi:uncharacterized protein (DUF2267 family)